MIKKLNQPFYLQSNQFIIIIHYMKFIIILFAVLVFFCSPMIPAKLFAGEIHYSRIPVEYWDHRLKMVRAMGMNAISVYVMWNYHQIAPGVFDFQTENRNLSKFMELAQANNLYVLIRPGPYVCAQWDFGGMPAWLLENNGLTVRTNTPIFLAASQRYINAVSPIIKKYLLKNGGPIILLQIQNQYGNYASDLNYINAIRAMWSNNSIIVDQYHADTSSAMTRSHWVGANIGINGAAISQDDFNKAQTLEPNAYVFASQSYPGWFTNWGGGWGTKSISATLTYYSFFLNNNHSFSMYMIFGGTNFGFTAGASTGSAPGDYVAHITSYDYDAPINEQGAVTAKYTALRGLILPFTQWQVPQPPSQIPVISINEFTPGPFASILQNLGTPLLLNIPQYFQSKDLKMYYQGIIVYQTILPLNDYTFDMIVHDYAIVFVDGNVVGAYDRNLNIDHNISFSCSSNCKLQILVEAMGHINSAKGMNSDRKGLIQFNQVKGNATINSWNHYKIALDSDYLKTLKNYKAGAYPVFSRASFTITGQIGDTYINMKNYVKGYVWVNGRNLGRFWNRGPQYKLFCPGVWLKQSNEIIVLQLGGNQQHSITGDTTLKLTQEVIQ